MTPREQRSWITRRAAQAAAFVPSEHHPTTDRAWESDTRFRAELERIEAAEEVLPDGFVKWGGDHDPSAA